MKHFHGINDVDIEDIIQDKKLYLIKRTIIINDWIEEEEEDGK